MSKSTETATRSRKRSASFFERGVGRTFASATAGFGFAFSSPGRAGEERSSSASATAIAFRAMAGSYTRLPAREGVGVERLGRRVDLRERLRDRLGDDGPGLALLERLPRPLRVLAGGADPPDRPRPGLRIGEGGGPLGHGRLRGGQPGDGALEARRG